MHHLLPSATVCVALFAAGCTAHVRTDDGRVYVGDVVESDPHTITVADGERFGPEDPRGPPVETFERLRIERAHVEDIDHPGNLLMVTGGAFVVAGGVAVIAALTADQPSEATADDSCESPHGGPACPLVGDDLLEGPELGLIFGATAGAIGLTLLTTGMVQYFGSARAAEAPTVAVGPGSLSVIGRF